MICITDGRIEVSGPVTVAGAATLLAEGEAALSASKLPVAEFDLASVTSVDSSLLAVVFGWMRAAKLNGKSIRLTNLPPSFVSLAAVYDVVDLLPQH
ncbi:MAG: STAS domain-containing protein [Rugosibacter sp.]|jgi:phospholipid transport system transporter-binding protein|nr:STAS domain-containing protein [Rugosibacter sp.]MDO9272145.1 STAS domain-containing protein [Rugosibacter sp.]